MKKLICFLLICSLALGLTACGSLASDDLMKSITPNPVPGSTTGYQGSAGTDFALGLFRQAYESQKNALISPLSVLCALSMTANGAEGETLAQMEQVLGLDVETLNQWLSAYMGSLSETGGGKLSLANAIWFKDTPTLTVEESFLQTNADYYGAGIYKAAFDEATKNDINRWVEENTDGMVMDILDQIPEEAVMYLVNALAFDAQWQEIYREDQIREGRFTTEDGAALTVEMMHSTENQYLEDAYATGFLKFYEGGRYAFAALLPNEGMTVAEYLATLSGEGLHEMLSAPDETQVQASIPKFQLEYDVEMSEILKAMGMTDAFDGAEADFSAMAHSEEGNIYISRVLHKTYICVDGKGTRAGAATAVEIRCEGAMEPVEMKTVTLDRPFVYMLIDTEYSMPLFIGAMLDPTGEFPRTPEPVLSDAPDMNVTWEGGMLTIQSGNYSWTAPGENGEMTGLVACGAHPLDGFREQEFHVVTGDTITLSFPVEPDELLIRRWPGSDMGNVDAKGETITPEGLTFPLEAGEWVYEITALWDRDTWSGEASYYLYLSR